MLDLQRLEMEGFTMEPSVLSTREIAELIQIIESTAQPDRGRGGVRDVMKYAPALRAVTTHPNVRSIVEQVLGLDAIVVRSTLFDKTGEANWKVPWHQDVTIAVRERLDTEGYGAWSVKQKVDHVQPPTRILKRMLTIRIHLDPCPVANGALRVMPCTHHLGRIDQKDALSHIDKARVVTCEAAAGEALVMRPLLLHASSAAQAPTHRRILHFDFADAKLDNGLQRKLC